MSHRVPNEFVLVDDHLELILTNIKREEIARVKIDCEDHERIRFCRWSFSRTTGYAVNFYLGHMHRIILGADQGEIVDHISLNKLDNRKKNLRFATASQNIAHRGTKKNNKSWFTGIDWYAQSSKWRVTVAGKHVGYFSDLSEAVAARNRVAVEKFGDFAVLQ